VARHRALQLRAIAASLQALEQRLAHLRENLRTPELKEEFRLANQFAHCASLDNLWTRLCLERDGLQPVRESHIINGALARGNFKDLFRPSLANGTIKERDGDQTNFQVGFQLVHHSGRRAGARERLRGSIYESPCPHSIMLSALTGQQVYLKLENLQMTGSFKERGALNRIALLTPSRRRAE